MSWATWLLFTGVLARCVVFRVRCPGQLGSFSPVRTPSVLCCLCCVLGHSTPAHRCARSASGVACAVSWVTWLLFADVPARCIGFRVRCLELLGSCSAVCTLNALSFVCGVMGQLAPVHLCDRSVRCVSCAVSWATWLLFTSVLAQCVVLHVWCPESLGSCARVCPLGVLCCLCGVLGHLAPAHRCARSECCDCCSVSWATWLLFTGAQARCVVMPLRCLWPLGSCSPVCPPVRLYRVSHILGHLAPVHRCARSACCVACAVSWATWLLFTDVLAPALCCLCSVLGHLTPVQRCVRSVRCAACVVSWATWLLFTDVHARRVVLRVRCARPHGSCSPVSSLAALCCVCGVSGHLAPVHRCARPVCCVACALSPAFLLLLTSVLARRVVLRVRCPGPLGSCSRVCLLSALCCVCGVPGHLAPGHWLAHSACGAAFAVSWATCLLITALLGRRVVLPARCPGPFGSCAAVHRIVVLCCVCGVLCQLAPVHRGACSVCCVGCAASWATGLLFTGVLARRVVLGVR